MFKVESYPGEPIDIPDGSGVIAEHPVGASGADLYLFSAFIEGEAVIIGGNVGTKGFAEYKLMKKLVQMNERGAKAPDCYFIDSAGKVFVLTPKKFVKIQESEWIEEGKGE